MSVKFPAPKVILASTKKEAQQKRAEIQLQDSNKTLKSRYNNYIVMMILDALKSGDYKLLKDGCIQVTYIENDWHTDFLPFRKSIYICKNDRNVIKEAINSEEKEKLNGWRIESFDYSRLDNIGLYSKTVLATFAAILTCGISVFTTRMVRVEKEMTFRIKLAEGN